MSNLITIGTSNYTLKVAKISELSATSGFYKTTDRILFSKEHVRIKNKFTNLYETIKLQFEYFGVRSRIDLNDPCLVKAEFDELKGLSIREITNVDNSDYKLDLDAGVRFYIVSGNICYVMTVVSFEIHPHYPNTQIFTSGFLHTVLEQCINKINVSKTPIDEITALEATVPALEATVDTVEAQETPTSATIACDPLQSSVIKSQTGTLDKWLPLLERETIYGIEMWRPAPYIKSNAVFTIYISPNGDPTNMIIARRGPNCSYTIKHHLECNSKASTSVVFDDKLYAIGFVSLDGKQNVAPPIKDIEITI
ncbi:hypothetical protein D5b_00211 [Faustovirus]|nr:hypothetical protein D5b_00211 [Faustovirus]AMN84703.1 hypothetical protein D6_00300 [Faustovirus]AMP44165.1 hypothetical protein PRJ_Dakar_00209 [Faustovirus]